MKTAYKFYLGLLANKWLLCFLFCLLALFLYAPTYNAKFTSDYLHWAGVYDQQGFKGILNTFDDPSLKYVYHFLMYGCHWLFKWNPFGWYLTFCILHGINASLLFHLLQKISLLLQFEKYSATVSFLASLFFLLSPYQAEAIVWAACIHFLFATLLLLISLTCLVSYWQHNKTKYLWGVHLPLLMGIFATEAIIILPLLLFLFSFLYKYKSLGEVMSWKRIIIRILIPSFIIIFLFVGLTFLKFGNPVGHYGAETHLNIDPALIGSNCAKYVLKFLFFIRYIDFDKRKFLEVITAPGFGKLFLGALAGFGLFLLLIFTKLNTKVAVLGILLASFFVALIPVINLETPFLNDMQSDRYGYLPSLFFYPAIVLACYFISKPLVRNTILILFAVINLTVLAFTNYTWYQVGTMINSLTATFPVNNTGKVYILNLVDNYKGAYVFRHGFTEALQNRYGHDQKLPEINVVSTINMVNINDSVKVEQLTHDNYHITIGAWGTWFWSAQTQQTPDYDLVVKEGSLDYTIHFNNLKKEDKIIYQAGKEWHYVSPVTE